MTDYTSFYNNQTSADPTRTLSLRSRWVADWNRRVARLKRAIWQSVVANDAFGLREDKSHLGSTLLAQAATPPLPVAQPKQWAYRWSHEKVEAFMAWLKEMESRSLLEVTERPGTLRPGGEPWSNVYVRSAYQSGLRRAMDEVNRRSRELGRTLGLTEDMLPPTFHPTGGAISAVMKQPFHADRLALAYTRVFDELKGVTAEMDKQISRALAMGIAEGQNPRDIGETIARRIEAIGETRGRLIARTETIHIHQQAALNEYYAVEEYTGETMLVQWKATMDSRTRDKHAERNMRVYTKEEAYKLIGEPNCRCALLPWIPSVQGMPEKATAAARAACEKALKEAGKEAEEKKAAEGSWSRPATEKEKQSKTRWYAEIVATKENLWNKPIGHVWTRVKSKKAAEDALKRFPSGAIRLIDYTEDYLSKSDVKKILKGNLYLEAPSNDIIVDKHLFHLSLVDRQTLQAVVDNETKFYLGNKSVPNLNEKSNLRGLIPRGWENTRWTWDDVAGCYDNINNKVIAGDGLYGTKSLVLHETGHAVGKLKVGSYIVEELPEFERLVHEAIKAKKITNPYLLQPGKAGLQETFAELFTEYTINEVDAVKEFGKDLVDWISKKPWLK